MVGTWWGLGKMAAELCYSLADAQAGMGDGVTPFYITGHTARGSRDRLNKLSPPASPNATLCTKCLRFHYNPGNQCLHVKCNPPNRPRSNSAPSRRPRPQTEDGPLTAKELEMQAGLEDARRADEMRASYVIKALNLVPRKKGFWERTYIHFREALFGPPPSTTLRPTSATPEPYGMPASECMNFHFWLFLSPP